MVEDDYTYIGYISNCDLHLFFQHLFENKNYEIVKKILSDSEMLYKFPIPNIEDYFVKDSQAQVNLKKKSDEHNKSSNTKDFTDKNDCVTKEMIKYYSGMESNYCDETNEIVKNRIEPWMCYCIIHMNFLEENNDYVYINLKLTTIVLLTLLLDTKLPIGIAAATLGALGINTTIITKLDEEKGENCILLEICSNRNMEIPSDFYKTFNKGECTNNHFKCKYRKAGNCTITEDAIKEVCNYFINRNIISLKNNCYKYNI